MNLSQHEHDFFMERLNSFVPERIFDAHCHIWGSSQNSDFLPDLPESISFEEIKKYLDMLHPGREVDALLISIPVGDVEQNNRQTAREIMNTPSKLGLMCVSPKDSPESVEKEMAASGLRGLKVYHIFSDAKPTWQADIPQYLPESFMELADANNWIITLHMVKSSALADESNLRCIQDYCKNYPNARLILAHSARAFQPDNNLEALQKLSRFDNLFFDSSANCEPIAHQAIIRYMGYEKLLYGSDFYISHFRGRSLSASDSFLWLYQENPIWQEKHQEVKPILVGLEHLRSLKWACWSEKLTDSQIEAIFYSNAINALLRT